MNITIQLSWPSDFQLTQAAKFFDSVQVVVLLRQERKIGRSQIAFCDIVIELMHTTLPPPNILACALVTPAAERINTYLRRFIPLPCVTFDMPTTEDCSDQPPSWSLALQAADLAWRRAHDAGFANAGQRVAVIVGSSRSAHWSPNSQTQGREPQLQRLVNTTQTALAGFIARRLRCNGPRLVISSACTSATAALCVASDMLSAGSCDAALVGAVDCGSAPGIRELFHAAGLPLAESLDECRPFDLRSRGLFLNDAAGFFLLSCKNFTSDGKTSALPLAQIVAHALNSDERDRCGVGATTKALGRCLEQVICNDCKHLTNLLHVHAHGTGNPRGDYAELQVLKKFSSGFSDTNLKVFASKHLTGHCLGATPAVELGITLACLQSGVSPPVPGLHTPSEGNFLDFSCGFLPQARFAIVANFGLWGTAAALLVKKTEPACMVAP